MLEHQNIFFSVRICIKPNVLIQNMSLSKLQEVSKDREAWHAAVPGVFKSQIRLSKWMTTDLESIVGSLHMIWERCRGKKIYI